MIGFGYDSHKFKPEGKLFLGGVFITDELGVIAHSDGDALLHALIDAILGAAGLGDIGTLFPDTDDEYQNADSISLLEKTLALISDYNIINIDSTVLLEKVKLLPFKDKIRKKIAMVCNIDEQRVSIKAKTNETMGFVGRNEGVACYCVVQIEKKQ